MLFKLTCLKTSKACCLFSTNWNTQFDGNWNGGTGRKVEGMELASCLYYFAKRFRDVYYSSFSLQTEYLHLMFSNNSIPFGNNELLNPLIKLDFYCHYNFQCSLKALSECAPPPEQFHFSLDLFKSVLIQCLIVHLLRWLFVVCGLSKEFTTLLLIKDWQFTVTILLKRICL